jgi:hypothetical protein
MGIVYYLAIVGNKIMDYWVGLLIMIIEKNIECKGSKVYLGHTFFILG